MRSCALKLPYHAFQLPAAGHATDGIGAQLTKQPTVQWPRGRAMRRGWVEAGVKHLRRELQTRTCTWRRMHTRCSDSVGMDMSV